MAYPSTQLRFIDISQIPKGFAIRAPASGLVHPLDVLNQPLLSNGQAGVGVAIELNGNKLLAPFDGTVTEFSATAHRIQLKASNGITLLIVMPEHSRELMGEGFTRLVAAGQSISKGQPLLNFNLQLLQQNLKVDTPCYLAVMITNAEKLGLLFSAAKKVTAGEDVLLTITAKIAAKTAAKPVEKTAAKKT